MNISDSSIYTYVHTSRYVHNVYSGGNSGGSGWVRLLSAYTVIYTFSFIDPYLHIHYVRRFIRTHIHITT